VGPKADGTIPTASVNILRQVGQWLATNGSAIYKTTYPPSANPPWGSITRGTGASANRFHAIVFNWPSGGGTIRLPLRGTLSRAWLLKSGASVSFTNQGTAGIDIRLPSTRPDSIASVVELEFTGTVTLV
jgi:alpha-L-fucosidase